MYEYLSLHVATCVKCCTSLWAISLKQHNHLIFQVVGNRCLEAKKAGVTKQKRPQYIVLFMVNSKMPVRTISHPNPKQ